VGVIIILPIDDKINPFVLLFFLPVHCEFHTFHILNLHRFATV